MRRSEIEAAEALLERRIAERERHLLALVAETRVRVGRTLRVGLAAGGVLAVLAGVVGAWRLARAR